VSRNAYERLKAFCETSGISMSQFVESGIHEKLDDAGAAAVGGPPAASVDSGRPVAPRPSFLGAQPPRPITAPVRPAPVAPPAPRRDPVMTSAAARFAVEPPPPIIKPRPVEQEPKAPAEPTPGQIFTF
jgi:hypothetical protein